MHTTRQQSWQVFPRKDMHHDHSLLMAASSIYNRLKINIESVLNQCAAAASHYDNSVATSIGICGALQLVVSVGEFLAPDVVEVDARDHGESPPKGNAHAEERFCAH
eukprot:TRINITY_DN364_c0_g1_i1.p1 TRINITY_DN364_c0_g1~~TRINITY_DN364_c0_g1_i1.p1  ORF type:complete len:107 (+),score=14.75 TRINITY_DN364_c0_g1_i1:95-415(+)